MTVEEAQAELLRLLAGGTSATNAGVQSLVGALAQPLGQGGLLSQVAPSVGGGLTSGSLLTGALGSVTSGGGGFGGVLGLSPLVAGLRALFGGANQQALPELVRYVAPEAVDLSLGLTDGGRNLGAASFGQNGTSRVAPAITVNVSAMDSRSFADNSEQIAQAVRQAMLNSGALTDIVAEI